MASKSYNIKLSALNLTKKTLDLRTRALISMKEDAVLCVGNKKSFSKPNVTCIVASYNGEPFLMEALESLLNQDFNGRLQILVSYDRGTTDNTIIVLNQFISKNISKLKNKTFKIVFHSNKTYFRDRELSTRYADGEYTCFLDYDNKYYPERIREQYEFMRKKRAHFSFCSQNVIDEHGNEIRKRYLNVPPDYTDPDRMLLSNFIDMNEMMFDKHFFESFLRPALDLLNAKIYDNMIEDYFFGCIAAITKNITYLPKTLGSYRLSKYSTMPRRGTNQKTLSVRNLSFITGLQTCLFAVAFINSRLKFYNKQIHFNYVSSFSPNSDLTTFHFLGDFGVKSSEKLPIRLIHFGLSAVYTGIKVSAKYAKSKFINILFKKS